MHLPNLLTTLKLFSDIFFTGDIESGAMLGFYLTFVFGRLLIYNLLFF